jgi:hypothetical protein
MTAASAPTSGFHTSEEPTAPPAGRHLLLSWHPHPLPGSPLGTLPWLRRWRVARALVARRIEAEGFRQARCWASTTITHRGRCVTHRLKDKKVGRGAASAGGEIRCVDESELPHRAAAIAVGITNLSSRPCRCTAWQTAVIQWGAGF